MIQKVQRTRWSDKLRKGAVMLVTAALVFGLFSTAAFANGNNGGGNNGGGNNGIGHNGGGNNGGGNNGGGNNGGGNKPDNNPKPNKEVVISLHLNKYAVLENGIPFAGFTVHRTGDTSGTVTVGYCLCNGTAERGEDYLGTVGTITFKPGEKDKLIQVKLVNDKISEGSEYFHVRLKDLPEGAKFGKYDRATITIIDDDFKLPGGK